MAGSVSEDCGTERSTKGFLDFSSGENSQSGEALAEWRLSEQVDNGTPSSSPSYWDTDEDDDDGPKPSVLYGRYTWKIEKFSQISKRELKSEVFDVGGYKWYILIYPQGCDVCNHVSLFLCVANHDKLLPGWSHFAQFTIAVVNKDPKKSKYSDTLHRFWKKEHDWGWKKFMELSKVQYGFIVSDTLEIRAQVQIIREKAHRPFRCLDRQYRRELVRVYLTNVEQICWRLVEERREKLGKLIDDKVRWLSLCTFWIGLNQSTKDSMSREKTDVIMRIVVKHLFVEKEVTSTLVMDSLNSGLKVLEAESKSKQGKSILLESGVMSPSYISVEDDMFVLSDDVLVLLERASLESLPPKDEKSSQNHRKEGNSGDNFNKDSMERDERRLTELGRKTIETFVLAHIYSKKIEAAYQEAVAFKRQEELIREEEEAELAEIELKEKRRVAVKEKRLKKKMSKQKRNNRKGKDRGKDEKFNLAEEEKLQTSLIKERIEETYSVELAQSMPENDIAFDAFSDVTDVDDDLFDSMQLDVEDLHTSCVYWDADTSEALPSTELCGRSSFPSENGNAVRSPSSMDDSSSTCSTDSVPSVVINGPCKKSSSSTYRTQKSPSRGKNQRAMESLEQIVTSSENKTLLCDLSILARNGDAASKRSKSDETESKAISSSKGHMHKVESPLIKKDAAVSPQHNTKEHVINNRPSKPVTTSQAIFSAKEPPTNYVPLVVSKTLPNGNIASVPVEDESSTKLPRNHSEVTPIMQLPQSVAASRPEVKKNLSSKRVLIPAYNPTSSYPPVRSTPPSTRHIGHDPTQVFTVPMVSISQTNPTVSIVQDTPTTSTVETVPSLSRSGSITERQDSDSSTAIQSSASSLHQSYRGSTAPANSLSSHMPGLLPTSSFVPIPLLYSQPPTLASSVQNSTGTNHGLTTTGFTFGSITSETSQVNSSTTSAPLSMFNGPHNFDSHEYVDGFSTSALSRQTQTVSVDEFPHLDIINFLFDDELGNMEANRTTVSAGTISNFQHHLGQQFFPPNDMSTLVEMGSMTNGHFEQPLVYYDHETQLVYEGITDHVNRLTNIGLPVDFSMYGNLQFDGLVQDKLCMGYSSNLCVVGDGYPIHVPEYPNLACGVGAYAPFQPSSGH